MTNNKKRFILWVNTRKPRTIEAGRELLGWLKGKVEVIADNLDGNCSPDTFPPADFIIVLGGDGTILSTVRRLGEKQIPLIGVNMGKLGFLAEFSIEQLKEQFPEILASPKPYNERIMLHCRITGSQGEVFETMVVNEIAITAGPPFRMIEVSISIADEHLACCAGDGLIVATPTGSTAYNLSAGGPILSAKLDAAVITPLAAHSLSFRPIVVDLEKPIKLHCRDVHEPSEKGQSGYRAAVVMIDGQEHKPLKSEGEVVITADPTRFMQVRNKQHSQWHLLNTKLNWGVLPNYIPVRGKHTH